MAAFLDDGRSERDVRSPVCTSSTICWSATSKPDETRMAFISTAAFEQDVGPLQQFQVFWPRRRALPSEYTSPPQA
jgi:hypothetical protein